MAQGPSSPCLLCRCSISSPGYVTGHYTFWQSVLLLSGVAAPFLQERQPSTCCENYLSYCIIPFPHLQQWTMRNISGNTHSAPITIGWNNNWLDYWCLGNDFIILICLAINSADKELHGNTYNCKRIKHLWMLGCNFEHGFFLCIN